MAYIGRDTDKLSNIEVLDTITFDGSSSYTLQKNSVNFTPSSANNVLVSIDGVVQANNFTVSGSTIDFGVAVPGTSTCDWIYHIGVGLITTPADGTVTNAKIASSIITGQTEDTTPADNDLILTYDTSASALKKVQKSNFAGGGITEADIWRLTANITSNTDPISSNLERVDDASSAKIGTGMSVTSGVWTFPTTGLYKVEATGQINCSTGDTVILAIYVTQDNGSNWDLTAYNAFGGSGAVNESGGKSSTPTFFNVTDVSNDKVKFVAESINPSTVSAIRGNTDYNYTVFSFIRLGDSQ